MSARRARGMVGRWWAQRRRQPLCLCPRRTGSSRWVSACFAALELLCFRPRRGAPVRGGLR